MSSRRPLPLTTVLVADYEPSVARITSRVVGTFCTALPPVFSLDDLEETVATQVPGVVLLGVRFQNDLSSLDLLPRLARSYQNVHWILYTGCPERAPAGLAFTSGALGYLTKPASTEELRLAIETVLSGGLYLSPSSVVRQQTRLVSASAPLSPCQAGCEFRR